MFGPTAWRASDCVPSPLSVMHSVHLVTSYIPQGQPYCNMSIFIRAVPTGYTASSPDIVVVRVRSTSPYGASLKQLDAPELRLRHIQLRPLSVARRENLRCVGFRPLSLTVNAADQLYICPTDTYPLYTDTYSAGTFFVYVFLGEGVNVSLAMMPIAGPKAVAEDLSWFARVCALLCPSNRSDRCDATLSTLPAPFAGSTAELLTDGLVNATSTTFKVLLFC